MGGITDSMTQKAQMVKSVGRESWLAMLHCMTLARQIEERLVRLYHQGRLFGGVYTGIGQEAIGAATTGAGGPDDLFSPLIRNMTVHIGRGETARNIFRQYLGRANSPTRGRDGNVHHGSVEHGVLAMISHLGAMLPVLTGGVMARRRLGRDCVGMAYIGDGATSTGDFHEAVNFAAVFDVPVIFVIENNKYAYSTPSRHQYRCERIADRAVGYGIEGFLADGNDLVELHLMTRELVGALRAQPKPVLLEVDTLRMRGHGEHDDSSYVPKDLRELYARRDPIRVARERLIAEKILTAADIEAMEKSCADEVDKAYHLALSDPKPDPATLMGGVYADA